MFSPETYAKCKASGGYTKAETDALLAAKVNLSQGVAHAGDFLVVGADGNVTTQTIPNANGVSF